MGGWYTGVGSQGCEREERGFSWVSSGPGPSSRFTDLLSTLLLWVWRTSLLSHGLLAPRWRGAGEGWCSCGSTSRCFSSPVCGCACSEVSVFLDLSTSWSNSKSWINRSVQGYCCLPFAFLLSLWPWGAVVNYSQEDRAGVCPVPYTVGEWCLERCTFPLLLPCFVLSRANLASAVQLCQYFFDLSVPFPLPQLLQKWLSCCSSCACRPATPAVEDDAAASWATGRGCCRARVPARPGHSALGPCRVEVDPGLIVPIFPQWLGYYCVLMSQSASIYKLFVSRIGKVGKKHYCR